jgi:PhoH-like ATPase
MTAKKKGVAKIFVLDTNVLLHDHNCLYNFQDNDVIIPIVVLEELDKFKKGSDQINYQAREFVRIMDKLAGEKLFTDGVPLGPDKGRLFIATGKPYPKVMEESFAEDTPDHRILAITIHVTEIFKDRTVVLISKDINLRMKAKSLGLKAEDYETDKVKDIEVLHKGVENVENFDPAIIKRIYDHGSIPRNDFPMDKKQCPSNQYFVLKNGATSVLVWSDPFNNVIRRIEKENAFGIEPRNADTHYPEGSFRRHSSVKYQVSQYRSNILLYRTGIAAWCVAPMDAFLLKPCQIHVIGTNCGSCHHPDRSSFQQILVTKCPCPDYKSIRINKVFF